MPYYFTEETDEYIKRYLETDDEKEKHRLFDEGIRPALEKLIENMIFVYKFWTLDDDIETLKKDCLANLYLMLPKFKPELGTKGFSYFNVITKNWFIQKTRERSKKTKREKDLFADGLSLTESMTFSSHENNILEKEFWKSFFVEIDLWRSKLLKKNERIVLESVIFLIKNPELASIYNKKAVYLYIREMTGLNEKQVGTILKKMREMYAKWKIRYLEDGE